VFHIPILLYLIFLALAQSLIMMTFGLFALGFRGSPSDVRFGCGLSCAFHVLALLHGIAMISYMLRAPWGSWLLVAMNLLFAGLTLAVVWGVRQRMTIVQALCIGFSLLAVVLVLIEH
jgi:hypothetical protein